MATPAPVLDGLVECLPFTTAPVATRSKCVLLIEDSKDAMCIVRYALKEYGRGKFRLKWANCLSDGLSLLLKGGIDIVLLDLGLPDSSGATSYAWVREAAPEVPVVVLTGDARGESEFSAFAGGVADYLVKEMVSGSTLVSVIESVLNKDKPSKSRRTKLSGGGNVNEV